MEALHIADNKVKRETICEQLGIPSSVALSDKTHLVDYYPFWNIGGLERKQTILLPQDKFSELQCCVNLERKTNIFPHQLKLASPNVVYWEYSFGEIRAFGGHMPYFVGVYLDTK